ncbi:hypothetical protein LINGRAPRIM_LOCUS3233 [Linum grandiflorum]
MMTYAISPSPPVVVVLVQKKIGNYSNQSPKVSA